MYKLYTQLTIQDSHLVDTWPLGSSVPLAPNLQYPACVATYHGYYMC